MSTSKKINIVFILADDLAVWAAGCYGNAEILTPNLDRFATTGVRFENFFVTIPVCSASRASFLTGRIPSQHGVPRKLQHGSQIHGWWKGQDRYQVVWRFSPSELEPFPDGRVSRAGIYLLPQREQQLQIDSKFLHPLHLQPIGSPIHHPP